MNKLRSLRSFKSFRSQRSINSNASDRDSPTPKAAAGKKKNKKGTKQQQQQQAGRNAVSQLQTNTKPSSPLAQAVVTPSAVNPTTGGGGAAAQRSDFQVKRVTSTQSLHVATLVTPNFNVRVHVWVCVFIVGSVTHLPCCHCCSSRCCRSLAVEAVALASVPMVMAVRLRSRMPPQRMAL